MTLSLTLVRHAPVIAPKRLIYGSTDFDADTSDTATIERAKSQMPTDCQVIVSALKRTDQTRAALGLPQANTYEPRINEQHFGDWEQKPLNDVGKDHEIWANPHGYRPANGERWIDVRVRVADWLGKFLPNADGDWVIVGHSGSLKAIVAEALDLTDAAALRLNLATLSVSKLTYFAKTQSWRVSQVGSL